MRLTAAVFVSLISSLALPSVAAPARCTGAGCDSDSGGCLAAQAADGGVIDAKPGVCGPSDPWNSEGPGRAAIPECGSGVDHAGQCVCPSGMTRDHGGVCVQETTTGTGLLPKGRASSASSASSAYRPTEAVKVWWEAMSARSMTLPTWVWRVVAAGVVLSVLLSLYLLGSIFGGLRSRRSRIGPGKYCVRCGARLEQEDSFCHKCNASQP